MPMKLTTFLDAIKSLIGGLGAVKESHPIVYAGIMLLLIVAFGAGVYFMVLV